MAFFKTILHATDFSVSARRAFQLACTLAAAHGCRLIVLHVHETAGPLLRFGPASVQLEPSKHLDKLLKVLRRFHAYDPGVRLEHQIVSGDPATRILQVADENGCDLIVMGTKDSSGLTKSGVGSVAEAILQKGTCPVLIMRVPQHDDGPQIANAVSEEAQE
jgi:nucleotide-binding universal stress UspA family protein